MPVPDGGYGWIVCGIACLISSAFGTMDYGFITMMGPLIEYFKTTPEVMSLGGSFISVVQYLFAPLFCDLARRFGPRVPLLFACLIAAGSIVTSTFPGDVSSFIILFCVVPGLCFGQMLLSSVMILNTYFDKKIVIAHGFFNAAMTLGTMLPSVIENILIKKIGIFYVTVFLGSIFILCTILLPFFKSYKHVNEKHEDSNQHKGEGVTKTPSHGSGGRQTSIWSVVGNLHGILFFSSIILYWVAFNMSFMYLVEIVEFQSIPKVTLAQRSMVVFLFCLINGTSRVLAGFIATFAKIPPQLMASIGLIINSAVVVLIGVVNNYYYIMIFILLYGILVAPSSAFFAPTTIKLFGVEHSDRAIAIQYLCVGIGLIPGGPIGGIIFKMTQNYLATLSVSAVFFFLSAVCNIGSFLVHSRFQSRQDDDDDTTTISDFD